MKSVVKIIILLMTVMVVAMIMLMIIGLVQLHKILSSKMSVVSLQV